MTEDPKWYGQIEARMVAVEKAIDGFSKTCTACRFGLDGSMSGLREDFDQRLDKLEDRLRHVEHKLFLITGIAAAGGGAAAHMIGKFL